MDEAFKDNVVPDYAGLPVKEMTPPQREQLLDRTYFAWIGATDPQAVFYYRIHSPVVLIEFDHRTPAGLRHPYEKHPHPHEH